MAKWFDIFLSLLFLPFFIYPAQINNIRFENLAEVIPARIVFCIYQDSQGFLWFGSAGEGLIRYDGMKCTVYQQVKGQIRDICEQKSEDGTILWIATFGSGLWKYNLESDSFFQYCNDRADSTSLSCDKLMNLYIHNDGSLWIGATQGGLNILRPGQMHTTNPKFLHIKYNPDDSSSINANDIRVFYKDKRDTLWIGTLHGISKMISGYQDGQPFKFRNYLPHRHGKPFSRTKNHISAILEDREDYLWIGIRNQGVFRSADPLTSGKPLIFKRYLPNPAEQSSIIGLSTHSLFEDSHGNIWMPSNDQSVLNLYIRRSDSFIHYHYNYNDPESYPLKSSCCMFEDRSGNLWFGGGGGVAKLSLQKQKFKNFIHMPGNNQSLLNKNVAAVCEDRYGNLWLGNSMVLTRIDPVKNEYTHFQHDPAKPTSIGLNTGILALRTDPSDQNYLWLGMERGSLQKLDIRTGIFTHYGVGSVYDIFPSDSGFFWLAGFGNLKMFHPKSGRFDMINTNGSSLHCVYEDSRGNLWAGTFANGLMKYDYATDTCIWYQHNPKDNTAISMNKITVIHEDKKGVMWFGTGGAGLNKFETDREIFTTFTVDDGLAHNYVCSILEDDHGFLWIGTTNGLSKFNPLDSSFKNYYKSDGIQGNAFHNGASYKSPLTGKLFFGGTEGCTCFHPDSIDQNPHKPAVLITDFYLFNKKVSPGENSSLKKSIAFCREITLPFNQNVFSFEFASLDYCNPSKNKYSFKMEGVDPDWVYSDANRRYVTYTRLQPGEYVFRVKASNNDGIWNEKGVSLRIIITPPWWRTTWAYLFYVIFIGSLIYGAYRFKTNRLKMQHQMELEHLHAEKLQELDRMKSRFFANISHEFRTPLTLILGPLEQMISGKLKKNLRDQYKMMRRNANRLLQLINQLLDLSKLEDGQLKLKAQKIEIISLLNGLVQAFESLAALRHITLKFESDADSIELYVDRDKFEKIINNLLSNAFKFTPERGKVEVALDIAPHPLSDLRSRRELLDPSTGGIKGEMLRISISNTGAGIPAKHIDKIFDRFYQADDWENEGTGIGLALTKELVELHSGKIHVDSTPGELTTFSIFLPRGKDHLARTDFLEGEYEETHREVIEVLPSLETGAEAMNGQLPQESSKTTEKLPLILVVEDNMDLQHYLGGILENHYKVIQAVNGEDGFDKGTGLLPDLIISDVMMPKMDGFELCRKLKTDERTSHIPVILMTARAAKEDKLEGLETGADDYIAKPFEAEELLVRVKNLIEQRRLLRKRFSGTKGLKPEDIAVTSADERFLKKALEIIERHLSDPEFGAEKFSRKMALSRVQLHRKLQALTDQSASEFARTVRLNRAAQLLVQKADNISQIAYEVGFNNPAYFSTSFRKLFGLSPREYIKEQSSKN